MRHQQWQKKEKIHFVFFPLFIYLPLIRCHRCRRFIVVSITSRLAITQWLKIFPFKIIVRYYFTRWNLFFCSISHFKTDVFLSFSEIQVQTQSLVCTQFCHLVALIQNPLKYAGTYLMGRPQLPDIWNVSPDGEEFVAGSNQIPKIQNPVPHQKPAKAISFNENHDLPVASLVWKVQMEIKETQLKWVSQSPICFTPRFWERGAIERRINGIL